MEGVPQAVPDLTLVSRPASKLVYLYLSVVGPVESQAALERLLGISHDAMWRAMKELREKELVREIGARIEVRPG